jgi:phenylacetate-coenzyme A ligase PaaK-like adenylate-forming protein
MFWNKEMETIQGSKLATHQLKRLKWTFNQVCKVPFYQQRLEEARIRKANIKSIYDIFC